MEQSRPLGSFLIILLIAIFSCPAQEAEEGSPLEYAAPGAEISSPHEDSPAKPRYTEGVPPLLSGVWGGDDRYAVFDSGYSAPDGGTIPQIVLRTFYTYYDDRAAESAEYTAFRARDVNAATPSAPAEELSVKYVTLAGGEASGAWNLEITYPGTGEACTIPVCVIEGKLYLSFAVREDASRVAPAEPASGVEFFRGYEGAGGLLISPPRMAGREITCYLSVRNGPQEGSSPGGEGGAIYPIRYWECDMEYDPEARAVLTWGGASYSVPKYIMNRGRVFTCVKGRRREVRNVRRGQSFSEGAVQSEDGSLVAFGEPYMTKLEGKTIEDILEEDSARRPPAPAPLFPPGGVLNFDWSIIESPPSDYNRRVLDLGK